MNNKGYLSCISIHSLRMEGDRQRKIRHPATMIISIHSLRMEGDATIVFTRDLCLPFQSTPSAWRETQIVSVTQLGMSISIHSLRMEGDIGNILPPEKIMIFQSTPSAWRETCLLLYFLGGFGISIHSLRMEGDSKTAQESVFHFAYPCTILQKRMQKTTFCTRKNGFFRKKGEKFGAKPSASFCAPMIRTDTFPLNFSHRISGSSMSMVSFAPICSTFD